MHGLRFAIALPWGVWLALAGAQAEPTALPQRYEFPRRAQLFNVKMDPAAKVQPLKYVRDISGPGGPPNIDARNDLVYPPIDYEYEIVKKDIFITGHHVVIDRPIEADGVNVVIVADELEINDPIDTRVLFSSHPQYWMPLKGDPQVNGSR
jgi:hypothetical protein